MVGKHWSHFQTPCSIVCKGRWWIQLAFSAMMYISFIVKALQGAPLFRHIGRWGSVKMMRLAFPQIRPHFANWNKRDESNLCEYPSLHTVSLPCSCYFTDRFAAMAHTPEYQQTLKLREQRKNQARQKLMVKVFQGQHGRLNGCGVRAWLNNETTSGECI